MSAPRKTAAIVLGSALIGLALFLNERTLGAALSPDGRFESLAIRGSILIVQLALVALGIAAMRQWRRIDWAGVALTLATLVTSLVALEVVLRMGFQDRHPARRLSRELGWELRPDLVLDHEPKGFGPVHVTTDERGFRRFDDVDGPGTRVFALGDSFTEALHVSDGEAYYDAIAAGASAQVFAHGTGGYGSLQSYMVLDRYFDEILPDVVVWQFSPNDVGDNSYPIEHNSPFTRMTRPYWIDGTIQHRLPGDNVLIRHSLALRWLLTRGATVMWHLDDGGLDAGLSRQPGLLDDALAATDEIMGLVQDRVGTIPIVAFEVAHEEWLGAGLRDILRRRGVHVVEAVPDSIEAARRRGTMVDGRPYNPHWSREGHRIAGQMVLAKLEQLGLVQPVSPTTDR